MLGKGRNFAHLFCCERNSAVKAETSKCREFRVVRSTNFACLKIPEYRTGSFFWQSACLFFFYTFANRRAEKDVRNFVLSLFVNDTDDLELRAENILFDRQAMSSRRHVACLCERTNERSRV